MSAARAEKSDGLGLVGAILRRSAWPVLYCAAACLIAAAIFLHSTIPTYITGAKLLIEPQRQQQLLWFEPGMLDLTLDNAQVESQVEVLRSEKIATAVVADLGLTEDPEFQAADGAAAAQGESLRVAISMLSRAIGVRRIGLSYVIEITAQSRRPERAAEIANAYTAAYFRDQFEAKSQAARQGVDWLQERIKELKGTLTDAARRVEDFKTRNDLVTASNGLMIEQQLSEMNSRLATARAEMAQAAARLARVREVGALGPAGGAVTEILNNQVITNLRQRQQDAASREAELRQRYGAQNIAVASAHKEAEEAEREISIEIGRIAQIYLSDNAIAVSRSNGIETEIQRLIQEADTRRQAKVTLSEMEAQAQSYRKMYQNLLEKLAETAQKETLPVSSARVIAPAPVPLGKSSPKTKMILALSAAVGLLAGVAIGAARHTLDRTVRSEADVTRATGLDCIGVVPRLSKSWRIGRAPLSIDVIDVPFSPFSRAVHGVKVTLDLAREASSVTIVGVTSVSKGEGKTSIALNLAALFAQAGNRTLLIDADFTSAALTSNLAPAAPAGLLEALSAGADAIVDGPIHDLSILPLILVDPAPHPSLVLRSPPMQRLLASLQLSYDLILVDLDAMRASTGARSMSRLLDGVVLVAAWGSTDSDALSAAAATLEAGNARLFGVVLNKVGDRGSVERTI